MKSVDCWKHAKILSILILLSACSSNSNNNNDNISIDTVGNISVHRVSSENNLKLVLIPNAPTSFWNLVRNGLNKFESEFSAKV